MGIPFTQLVKPFGENPSERFAPSCLRKILLNRTVPRTIRPFQGSHFCCAYNIRYSKATPRLKGEGDREAVERCAPGANVSPSHNLPTHSKTPRDESLGALHNGESS